VVAALLLLLSYQAPPAPVRVWLGSGPAIVAGEQERVYVQTSTDGHLVVLHARPDGRVEVLFPEDPARDPFVRAGTYEIRTPVSSGPTGRGMVLAAVSPDPIWFDEFVHRSEWDTPSLTAGWAGDDPEALLTDIVQRMLGDGSFNYDLVTYTVAPRPVAIVDTVYIAPQTPSVDLVVSDLPLRQVLHRHRSRVAPPAAAPAPAPPAAIAVYSVHRPSVLEPLPLRSSPPLAAPTPRHRIPEMAATVAAPATIATHAVPLVARARSAAAQSLEMPRAHLLTWVVHVTRSGKGALVPVTGPARSGVAAVAAPSAAVASPATPASPVAVPEPRGLARPGARTAAARAGTAEAAPAPARAGSATGVGLGQVHTAGWHH
jgi:Domain of unknown function (DUF4384)